MRRDRHLNWLVTAVSLACVHAAGRSARIRRFRVRSGIRRAAAVVVAELLDVVQVDDQRGVAQDSTAPAELRGFDAWKSS